MNKNSVCYIATFILGAAVGAAASWKLLKTKYEQLAQEEIESVKSVYQDRYGEKDDTAETHDDTIPVSKEKLDMDEYKRAVQKNNYSEAVEVTEPHVITPEEYGEIDEYDREFLTLYADGILADDYNEPIEDIDAVIGSGSLKRIGEYADDVLHVRNDKQRTDYEITRVSQKYSDDINPELYSMEEE